MMTINKIAIIVHPQNHNASIFAEKVIQYLKEEGKDVVIGRVDEVDFQRKIQQQSHDVLIAMGGDGTMLRAGHISGPQNFPILGINLGRFGFLTEISQDEWKGTFARLFDGDYWIENRMMLDIAHWRDDTLLGEWDALNEGVVSRGDIVRPIQLKIHINERHLSTYIADGIIAATPTGSTAYAMAAGGPILAPELRNIVLVPVAPHLSIEQPLVLDQSSTVSITTRTEHKATLTIDGQDPVYLNDKDKVVVSVSKHTVDFIRFQDPGYFYRNLIPYMDQNPSIKDMDA
ncbi:MAG: NAD(+)/NADH kinase [Anaerolineales bacterium]